jgi:hypothetical protein
MTQLQILNFLLIHTPTRTQQPHFVMLVIATALYTLLHYTLYKVYNAVAIKGITKGVCWVLVGV